MCSAQAQLCRLPRNTKGRVETFLDAVIFYGCLRNDPQLEGAASAKGLRRRNNEARTWHSKVTVQLSVLTQIVNFSVRLFSSEKQEHKQYQGCFLGLVKTHGVFWVHWQALRKPSPSLCMHPLHPPSLHIVLTMVPGAQQMLIHLLT